MIEEASAAPKAEGETAEADVVIVGDGALGSLVSNDSTWVSLQSHFMVDENGHRYLNEYEDDYRIGDDTMRNTGSAWVICDQAYPLTTAPYYVEKQGEYYFEVFTAVEVNDEGQVLTGDGTPVEGLLAVGQCSLSNIMTVLYGQGGTGLTFAACSGVYGARCAAQMLGM